MRKTNWDTMGTGDLSMGVQEVKKSNRKRVAEEEEVGLVPVQSLHPIERQCVGIRR